MKKFDTVIENYISEQIGSSTSSAVNINPNVFKTLNVAPNADLKKVADVLTKLLPQFNKDVNPVDLKSPDSFDNFILNLKKSPTNLEIFKQELNKNGMDLKDLELQNTQNNQEPEAEKNIAQQQQASPKPNTPTSPTSYTSQGPKA
jgi:hypothetical protein